MIRIKNILFVFALTLPMISLAQDTIFQKELNFENEVWNYNGAPFNGTSYTKGAKTTEYYSYCNGKPCGYAAYYLNGQLAGEHTYNGENIHLVFYTEAGGKTLEYNQIIKDHTYTYGEWVDYRDDGTLQVKGNYILAKESSTDRAGKTKEWASKKDGNWIFYNEKGEITKTEVWKKGVLKKTK